MSLDATAVQADTDCYHCGALVKKPGRYCVKILGESREMCCTGCAAVAQTIVDQGLESFYSYRTDFSVVVPTELNNQDLDSYDHPDFVNEVIKQRQGERSIDLIIDGMNCAACGWLIENQLNQIPGIQARMNFSTKRVRVSWSDVNVKLSEIVRRIRSLGFGAHPWDVNQETEAQKRETRSMLLRMTVSGLIMMQAMMFAGSLYVGADQGIEVEYRDYLRWVSLLVLIPLVTYCSWPFYVAAWRGIKNRVLGMDVSVSAAIIGAFLASAYATFTGTGDVYFETVSMFIFFLTTSRFLEMRARHRAGSTALALQKMAPRLALRLGVNGEQEKISIRELKVGDRVLVKAGEVIPLDGIVIDGITSVSEAVVTGEPLPVRKNVNDAVISGAMNVDQPIVIRVAKEAAESSLSLIAHLIERASNEKNQIAVRADTLANYSVVALLLVATLVFAIWCFIDLSKAFWIVLAMLVATCPCALSIATPAAITASTNQLARCGFLLTRGHLLDTLPKVTHAIFDKTGTLTVGKIQIDKIQLMSTISEEECLALADAIERYSEHPIAQAFRHNEEPRYDMTNIEVIVGQGINAKLEGELVQIGKPEFVGFRCENAEEGIQVGLVRGGELLAWFYLKDQVRSQSKSLIKYMLQRGIEISLLSGDSSDNVRIIAEELGIKNYQNNLTPEQKLDVIQGLHKEGNITLMVGDGVNDAPVLKAAHVSIAMGGGTDLAKTTADAVMLRDDLDLVRKAFITADKTQSIVKENLAWAVVYNLAIVPMAALGKVVPWVAALGMSLSSLIVVVNALRLSREVR